ncbi:MAG: DoxX family protein [Candidatus Dojkabacteria bacterium]
MAYLSKISNYKNFGLLIGRIGLGAMMMFHGIPKLMGGPEQWEGIGNSMNNFGINFMPVFWGFMASLAEGIGGLLIVLGLLFRPASILIILTLVVATTFHFSNGDGWMGASHAIETGFAFLILLFVGPGKYSVDRK